LDREEQPIPAPEDSPAANVFMRVATNVTDAPSMSTGPAVPAVRLTPANATTHTPALTETGYELSPPTTTMIFVAEESFVSLQMTVSSAAVTGPRLILQSTRQSNDGELLQWQPEPRNWPRDLTRVGRRNKGQLLSPRNAGVGVRMSRQLKPE
jgi:hypothetical protein